MAYRFFSSWLLSGVVFIALSFSAAVAQAQEALPENPLGPAATLPIFEENPATANALQPPTAEEAQMQREAELLLQKQKLEEQAFDAALKQLLPMQPGQIRHTLGVFKDTREAAETPIADPLAKNAVETISLDPSALPPVILLSPNRVTALTVLDATGAPWPIQDISWAGKFDVKPPEEGGHVIRLVSQTAHGVGNVSIRLVDLITPITFTLQTGLDEVHYRFDARIPKMGPNAKPPLIEHGGLKSVAATDESLMQVLDGTPPSAAEKLKVDGVDGRTTAWKSDGRIYLRTPLTLLSPAWDSSVASADGMNVYTLGDAPVVLLSDEGRMVRAHIMMQGETP